MYNNRARRNKSKNRRIKVTPLEHGTSTTWEGVGKWYADITKDKGHYFHEHVVIPGVKKILNLKDNDRIVDLACGTGVLARSLPKPVTYVVIDIAETLIEEAKATDKNDKHSYIVGDITMPLSRFIANNLKNQSPATLKLLEETTSGTPSTHIFDEAQQESKEAPKNTPSTEAKRFQLSFTKATCILALQNVENYQAVFDSTYDLLKQNGNFVIVLNHPAFRIPRQTSWGIDETNKLQYRKVNRYISPLKIPVSAHPSKGVQSPMTWSYHFPLAEYINGLYKARFVVTHMEEWTSDKESEGKLGKMENRARNEIPLFMTIVAKKL